MRIRVEKEQDREAVRAVNEAAFESPAEADLADALREGACPVVSLVAEDEGAIVGHVMFSPVRLRGRPDLRLTGLAPIAVIPERQREGIGSALVRAGLEACGKLGFGAVVVLGHPGYYPRFGFVPATRFQIVCEYDVPEGAFMIAELKPGYLHRAAGTVQYHAAFNRL